MYFGVKKFISQFLMPMPLVCECFILGWILVRFTQYKKTGRFFTLLSLILFLLFGYGFGSTYLYNLERRYPSFDPTPEQCEALRGTPVVVLGQGMSGESDLPLRYQNNPVFERRLFEGVRVAKLIPESQLIISMAGVATNTIKQLFLDEYMAFVNFPTNRVSMFTSARDTSEEAKLAKNCLIALLPYCVIGTPGQAVDHFEPLESMSTNKEQAYSLRVITQSRNKAILLLTTSASHLPRAMKIFEKAGFQPIPAPCDYTDAEPPENKFASWYQWPLPSSKKFDHSERAFYEWLGNLYESLF